jgi:two-component system cell cycle response regulator
MKVLVADDEAVSLRLLESSLRRWGYDTVVAKNGTEASKILMSPDAPKLAVLDWMMPDLEGVQLCQMIRRNKPEPYTYILLLTGKRSQGDVVTGLEAGADDYVTKPFDAAELKVRPRTGKRILYLQDQLISARESLRDQATHDQLTELWNRAAILDILNNELKRAQRQGASVAVALADLDFFKSVNDTHGHATGDEVLRKVAQALRGSVRRYDSVGRYGGEEFLIVLPGCEQSNALAHAERLRKAVEGIAIETPNATIRLSASIGVAISDERSIVDSFDLIQAADVALYRAKNGGRNRVELGTTASLLGV